MNIENFFMDNMDKIKAAFTRETTKEAYEILKDIKKCPPWNTFRSRIPQFLKITKLIENKKSEEIDIYISKLHEKINILEKSQRSEVMQRASEEITRVKTENAELQKKLEHAKGIIKSIKQEEIFEEKKHPKSFKNWTVQIKKGYFYIAKRIDKKMKWLYVGKKWDEKKADDLIFAFELEREKYFHIIEDLSDIKKLPNEKDKIFKIVSDEDITIIGESITNGIEYKFYKDFIKEFKMTRDLWDRIYKE